MAKIHANLKMNICNEMTVHVIDLHLPSEIFGFEGVKDTMYATPSRCRYLKCPGCDG